MKFYECAWKAVNVWWEFRLLGAAFGLNVGAWFKNLRSHLQRAEDSSSEVISFDRAITKAYDKRRRFDYLRCVLEHAIST